MTMDMDYDVLRGRLKEVSEIDTEVISFVKEQLSDCPDCTYDPITGESLDSFCPTCNGKGTVNTTVSTPLRASVNRITGLEHDYQPGGRLKKGTLVVTIHESQLVEAEYDLKSDWPTVFDYVVVGGDNYEIADNDSVIPQTLQGDIYEIVFHLTRKQL